MERVEAHGTLEESGSNNCDTDASQDLEENSVNVEDGCRNNEEHIDADGNVLVVGGLFDPLKAVNGIEDMWKVDLKEISAEEVARYHFPDLEVAFMFYNMYAGMHGFGARKSKVQRNPRGEITQQQFVCYRQGHREDKKTNQSTRKRVSKPQTRCGCQAKCRVHIEGNSGRWYIKYFNDVHNHAMVDDYFTNLLPAHRKMSEYDILQMKSMTKVGIGTSQIYGFLANEAGGFQNVGFQKRDMYNEQERQRQTHFVDAKEAVEYLQGMKSSDETMFCSHTIDEEGRLERLFWRDGISQRDYSVFGDVLAFDATYKKNKYLCPLVVFSGVNHHNQSVVFASAVVVNETEETYVWLLEQFLEAMGGKSPASVITDGDVSMRNAIKRCFPESHHRLCAWHLLNATSHVGNPKFVSKLRRCMLGDYNIREFKHRWDEMVAEHGLEENIWVRELYEKRNMWATAHIRGNFFAGFRTTSRCEGLHSEFGRYVNHKNNLLDFVQQFSRCLNFMRYKEVEADFLSIHGEPVIQTKLVNIEKSAAQKYTREILLLFRPVLERTYTLRVVDSRKTASCYLYTVFRYNRDETKWLVSFCPSSLVFKCCCIRFESLGIPCEHLVCVLLWLDIVVLPDCLVLNGWTKNAKESVAPVFGKMPSWDSTMINQYKFLIEQCKLMAVTAVECRKPHEMRKTIDLVTSHKKTLQSFGKEDNLQPPQVDPSVEGTLRNPLQARSKGCGGSSSQIIDKGKRAVRKPPTCGNCGGLGHNRKSCAILQQTHNNEPDKDNEVDDIILDFHNVEMHVDIREC